MLQRFLHNRAGAAAVEFAIVGGLFLVPLLLASADFVSVISAQSQLNTALQALYYFGVTNKAHATNATEAATIITAINSGSVFKLSLPATMTVNGSAVSNPSYTYVCYTTKATPPSFAAPSTTNNCSASQTAIFFGNYKVTATIVLPFPSPMLHSPLTLSAQGAVQIVQ